MSLTDMIGRELDFYSARMSQRVKAERPFRVYFAILTAGFETPFVEYTRTQVRYKVERLSRWDVVFCGFNINAFACARSYYIDRD